jgi:hypothetical protein
MRDYIKFVKKCIKNILIVSIPTIIFLLFVLELVFRFVIPACNRPQAIFDEKTRLYRYKANQNGLFTIGKFAQQTAKYRINNYGWNSPIDYSKKKSKPRIAIIGDSYKIVDELARKICKDLGIPFVR